MKKNAAAFIFVLMLITIATAVCFSNARYQSSVTVTQQLDYAKTIGNVSLSDPQNVLGYNEADNSFRIGSDSFAYENIRFSVANSRTVTENETEKTYMNEISTDYYIRVVPSDDASAAAPVDYIIYKENGDAGKDAYPVDKQTGYCGPFNLPSRQTISDFRFSMQIGWTSAEKTLGIHKMSVQLVKKRSDDSFKVIGETELNFKFVVTINYYAYGSNEFISSQYLSVEKDTTIDFTDTNNPLGIEIPKEYYFKYASSHVLNWAYAPEGKITVTDEYAAYPIQAYLVKTDSAVIVFDYRDRSQDIGDSVFKILSEQKVQIKKGTTINFKDPSALSVLGINIPSNYTYIATHCHIAAWTPNPDHYYQDEFTVPTDTGKEETLVDVYIAPSAQRTVKAILSYDVEGTATEIDTIDMEFAADGSYTFTLDNLRTLDPNFATRTYFDIYVKNTNNNNSRLIGNPYSDGSPVTVNYFEIYQYPDAVQNQLGFCLANPIICLYIIAWW